MFYLDSDSASDEVSIFTDTLMCIYLASEGTVSVFFLKVGQTNLINKKKSLSPAGLEFPVSVPKKLYLTKENLKAVLGHDSHIRKTPSTLSRGSAQTSGGRGPGKSMEQ